MSDASALPFTPADAKLRHTAILRETFSPELRAFIAQTTVLFVASVGADGRVDVSPKGGVPGFVHVLGDRQVAWGERPGNRMYMTGSNLLETGRVGLCFIDPFTATIARVNGQAELVAGDLDGRFPESDYAIVVTADEIFPNCGRALKPLQEQMTAFLGQALAKMRSEQGA